MPLNQEIAVRRPIIINSIAGFRGVQTLTVEENSVVAGSYQVNGDASNRGAFYLEDPEASPTVVLLRGGYGNQSGAARFYTFGTAQQATLGPNGSTPTQINNIHNIDGNFWVLGVNQFGKGCLHYKPALGTLLSTSGWTDNQSDIPYATSSTYFMNKATSADRLYCIAWHTGGSNELMVMRAIASSPGSWDDISVTPRTSATAPTAYGVRDDGQTQILAYGASSEARSTDGGVNWSSLSIGINGITDIVYSKAFSRWVVCAPTTAQDPGVRYSSDDGVNWSDARMNGGSAGAGTFTRFSHIEKIDADGRYLLGVRGFAPIRTFISENGGATWTYAQGLLPPDYDTAPPNNQTVLINTGSRILLYQCARQGGVPEWNFDNMMFESGLTSLEVAPIL